MKEHLRLYGTFHVEKGLNRMEGDYLFTNVGRTNILMYSLVDRLRGPRQRHGDVDALGAQPLLPAKAVVTVNCCSRMPRSRW
ncbi:hypothetical protein [Streptomyces colonosanans]|uniref:hypothetical protein n=1 Tax=Streptomyces colonosanans TaxID=1428652 RepID=UPI00115F87A8|nr:hypothetical protein [Streptomyces colonosanans]